MLYKIELGVSYVFLKSLWRTYRNPNTGVRFREKFIVKYCGEGTIDNFGGQWGIREQEAAAESVRLVFDV